MKIRINKKKIYIYVLFAFLYIGIFIDNIVGYQMRITGSQSSISRIYRFINLIVIIFMLFSIEKKNKIFTILICAIFLPILQALNNWTLAGIMVDELYVTKLFFPVIIIVTCKVFSEKGLLSFEDIDRYLSRFAWIYPLTVLIPYGVNLGFKAYGASGYSGFYSAGNELSIILAITFVIHMNNMLKSYKGLYLIGALMSALATILTGTKAGVIVIVLTFLYYIVKNKGDFIKKNIYIVLGAFLFGTGTMLFLNEEINASIARLQYKYRQLNNNWLNFLFSNRNIKIIPNLKKMFENPISILFGKGYHGQVLIYGESNIASPGLIEMDFFDVLFQYGIIIVFYIWGIYISCFWRYRKTNRLMYTFSIFIMLLYSFFAGHTLYSAPTGTLLALLCVGVSIKKKEMV